MKLKKLVFVSVAAIMLISLSVQAKNEMKRIYIYGFASSFNDSTVYFTDVQELDSAWLTSKNHFLISRDNYSNQLRDYLSSIGEEHRTCMVGYSTNFKKAENEWSKLYARYTQKQKKKNKQKQKSETPPYQVKNINRADFSFKAISAQDEYDETPAKPVKKVKAKKASKQQKKTAPSAE